MSTVTLKKQTITIISFVALLIVALSAVTGYTLNNKSTKTETPKISTETKPVTEVKQVSEPTKVAIVEESKKSEAIKIVLTPEEIKKVETKIAEKTKSEYTSPYFPTLKLPYTSDWNFNTSTGESEFKGLLSRQISFTKNSVGVSSPQYSRHQILF
jgi:hypothetical protein